MKAQQASPFYVYSSAVGIRRVDPLVQRRNSETKLQSLKKFAVGDAPTPKRGRPGNNNPNLPHLKHLLYLIMGCREPLHDEYTALEEKLAILEKLWAEAAVPLDYYSHFLNTLKRKVSRREQLQLVLKEVRLLRDRRSYPFFQITETIRARENVLGLILPYFEKMGGDKQLLLEEVNILMKSLQADILVHYSKQREDYNPVSSRAEDAPVSKLALVIKHIQIYRQLTTNVIRLIWNWGCELRREGYVGPAQFRYHSRDYFEKISEQDSLLIHRCSELFDRHPYCLVRKEHQKDEFALLWRKLKPNPVEANEILESIQLLAAHSSAVLKMQLTEAHSRELEKVKTQQQSPLRAKSLVERLYSSQIKLSLPVNYLQRKHPVYVENPEPTGRPFRVEEVRHQKSLLVEEQLSKHRDLFGRVTAKATIEMLDGLNSERQHQPQRISNVALLKKDYEKLTKLKFPERFPPSPQPKGDPEEHTQDEVPVEQQRAEQPPPQLTFLFVQMEEDKVLDFLENLFLERERQQHQLDQLLRSILSHRDCTILKVSDENRPGRDKLASLVIAQQQTLPNGKLEFQVVELLLFNGTPRKVVLEQLTNYLQQYSKYSSLAVRTSGQLNILPVAFAVALSHKHFVIQVEFRVAKKHREQLKDICQEYPHLRRLYKSRHNDNNKYLVYDEHKEIYEFLYQARFNIVSALRIITNDKGATTPYLQIRMDKAIKLRLGAHRSIQAYKLVQFGLKEYLQVVFNEEGSLDSFDEELLDDSWEQPPLTNLEVLLPVLNVKMKYVGADSDKVLFRESLKLSERGVPPLSLIRSKAKYVGRPNEYLFVPERFLLRVVSRDGDVLFSKSF